MGLVGLLHLPNDVEKVVQVDGVGVKIDDNPPEDGVALGPVDCSDCPYGLFNPSSQLISAGDVERSHLNVGSTVS
jgi:hypothetical protein